MAHTSTFLEMTFKEAMEKICGRERSELYIRYQFTNDDEKSSRRRYINFASIYEDWCTEGMLCPANDAKLTDLRILLTDHTVITVSDSITFEAMIEAIVEHTQGQNFMK